MFNVTLIAQVALRFMCVYIYGRYVRRQREIIERERKQVEDKANYEEYLRERTLRVRRVQSTKVFFSASCF